MNKCKIKETYYFESEGDFCMNCKYYKECMDIYERYYLS